MSITSAIVDTGAGMGNAVGRRVFSGLVLIAAAITAVIVGGGSFRFPGILLPWPNGLGVGPAQRW